MDIALTIIRKSKEKNDSLHSSPYIIKLFSVYINFLLKLILLFPFFFLPLLVNDWASPAFGAVNKHLLWCPLGLHLFNCSVHCLCRAGCSAHTQAVLELLSRLSSSLAPGMSWILESRKVNQNSTVFVLLGDIRN